MTIITGSDHTPSGMPTPVDSGYWSVLIAESVHLLGLFLSHTQNARNSRATAPLVDQFIRHLYILSKMPSQTEEIRILQSNQSNNHTVDFLGYRIVFGPIEIPEPCSPESTPDQFMKVLSQGFRCLMDQGIHSIRLRIPDRSIEQAEQLRLALNIAARYRKAADTLSSITFHYFDRVMTVPLVSDSKGRPDPNLTITAGLNGLSSSNARTLIRQADALCRLAQEQDTNPQYPDDTYERLFSLRNLRTHLVKPLIEVNTCGQREREIAPIQRLEVDSVHTGQGSAAAGEVDQTCGVIAWQVMENRNSDQKLLDVVGADDYESADAQELARRLLYASKLLSDFEKSNDPYPRIRLLHLLKEKYENAPELILHRIKTLRSGLKIAGTNQALVIGLIHPGLLDLLACVRERLLSADRCAAAESFDMAVRTRSERDLPAMARRFKIEVDEIRQLFNLLTDAHDADGAFSIDLFQHRIERATLSHTFFMVLWYLFKCTFVERGSAGYFQTVKHAAANVSDKKGALRFLLADLLQTPFDVIASDRYALFFSNMFMLVNKQEGCSDNDFTPSNVLKKERVSTGETQQNAVLQLELNQVAVLTKMRTIHDRLKESLAPCTDETANEESRSLLRLEREFLLFAALTGGITARMLLCGIFSQYEDLLDRISRSANRRRIMDDILDNLHIAVKGLQRVGQYSDLDFLRQLDNSMIRLQRFDEGLVYNQSIQRLIDRITSAVKSIRLISCGETAGNRQQ